MVSVRKFAPVIVLVTCILTVFSISNLSSHFAEDHRRLTDNTFVGARKGVAGQNFTSEINNENLSLFSFKLNTVIADSAKFRIKREWNKQVLAEDCKKKCQETEECNAWQWCGVLETCMENYLVCQLLKLPIGNSTAVTGDKIPYTSGLLTEKQQKAIRDYQSRKFHTLVTASGHAAHWQIRIHYYWFKKIQRDCVKQGGCLMGGWTRLLHDGRPDDLMEELPTVVVDPLDNHDTKGYVVIHRPWAVVQWLKKEVIEEKYVLMGEPDHLFIKPLPNIMEGEHAVSFPFFYIAPADVHNAPLVKQITGEITQEELESIPTIGNSPTLLSLKDLNQVAQTWMDTSIAILKNDETHKILEMYGFAIACFLAKLPKIKLETKLIAQPPWDMGQNRIASHYMLHYTYGVDMDEEGVFTPGKHGFFHFDKRSFDKPPGYGLPLPPRKTQNYYTLALMNMLNEAMLMIPDWEHFSKTNEVRQYFDGETFANTTVADMFQFPPI